MMRAAHVLIVVFVLSVAVCFALGFDRIMIGLLATGGGVAAEATRRRKKAEAELTDATGDRDRQLGALRAAMARADELAQRQAELNDEAADVHRAADDAMAAARKLDAE